MPAILSEAVRRGFLILAVRDYPHAAERTGTVIRWNTTATTEELDAAVREILKAHAQDTALDAMFPELVGRRFLQVQELHHAGRTLHSLIEPPTAA